MGELMSSHCPKTLTSTLRTDFSSCKRLEHREQTLWVGPNSEAIETLKPNVKRQNLV